MLLRKRLLRFCTRLATYSLIAGILMSLPDVNTDSTLRYKNAAIAFTFVISLGKLLFDTFFYERHP